MNNLQKKRTAAKRKCTKALNIIINAAKDFTLAEEELNEIIRQIEAKKAQKEKKADEAVREALGIE
jgi:hypothetical protein